MDPSRQLIDLSVDGGKASKKKSKSRLVKKRSLRFTLPTSRELPFVHKTGARVDQFGTQTQERRSEYSMTLPVAIPLPRSNSPQRRVPEQNAVAHQYHSTGALACMRKLAVVHPSLEVRQEWALRAEAFEAAGYDLGLLEGVPLIPVEHHAASQPEHTDATEKKGKKKSSAVADVGKGLGILVGTPIIIGLGAAATGVAATGLMIYGSGKMLIGLGRAMTFGKV
jgi:hypothetical protein